jgi:hypothetical protein
MPRGSVTVHQGGIGTTAQALRAGKPELIVRKRLVNRLAPASRSMQD